MSQPPPVVTTEPEADDPLQPRPSWGCLLLVIPVLVLVGGVVGYIGMFILGVRGREATGERVEMAFSTCAEARPHIADRVALMGLGDPTWTDGEGGFTLTATLPADPIDAAGIPTTLAAPGRLEIYAVEGATDASPVVAGERVEASTVHLGMEGVVTLVRLDSPGSEALRAHMVARPEGHLRFLLDGETIFERSNLPAEARGSLEIPTQGPSEQAQMRVAAARSIILDAGPLPCPATAQVIRR